MKWSFKLVRVAGIDVYVHATFFILLLWVSLSYWRIEGTLGAVLSGVGFILVLFTCVVLHEFGHALTARRYGIQTLHITLFPIGGIAAVERMPEVPKHEITVALAGPAVNLFIAFFLWLWLSVTNTMVSTEELTLTGGSFAQRLMLINIILAVFNLIPAFPMDGGRILRAVLAIRMNHNKATQLAARVGQGFALWLGLIGLLFNPFLMFIALFVWIGAASEAVVEEVRSTLLGISAGQAMLTNFEVLSPHDRLHRAIQLTLAGSQKDFPVLYGEDVVGVLTHTDLLRGLHEHGDQESVGDWMQTDIQCAEKDEPLEEVFERLQRSQCRLFPVMESGQLAGILNMDNVVELLSIQKALH
jgi:Zn-dependent protease/predicted transcriptional regulator